MSIFNKEWFELEKKKDGIYRCKGGHLADILLLGGGVLYLSFLWIIQPVKKLFNKVFGWIQTLIFGIR